VETPAFRLAPDAQAIAARLIDELFDTLTDQRIVCVLSEPVPVLRGSACAAFIAIPIVQGALRDLFGWFVDNLCAPVLEGESPDYLVLLHAERWPTLSPEAQERLVFHELSHVEAKCDTNGIPRTGRDGRTLTKLVPHDYELFDQELRRYGADLCDAQPLVDALAARRAAKAA
jgi:predicted metallopeptidase